MDDTPTSAGAILRPLRDKPGRWVRSAETRRSVLDAASSLFAERGYEGTSIDDIVKRSGVSVGSIYHQFDGKPDIFLAVAVEEFDRNVLASSRAMKRAQAAGASPSEVYLAGAEAFLMSVWRKRDVARIMLGDQGPANYDGLRREALLRFNTRAAALRLIGTPPTPQSSVHAVLALIRAASVEMLDFESPNKARRIAKYYLDLIRHLLVDEAS